MGWGNRKPWGKPQGEAGEVAERLTVEQSEAGRQPRTLTSFPSKFDGRDGDTVVVRKGGKVYNCRKVSGRWRKTEMESV